MATTKNYTQSSHTPLSYRDGILRARRLGIPPEREAQLAAVKQYAHLIQVVTGNLSRMLLDFTLKKIPATTFEARMKAALRGVYRHAYRFGMQAAGWPSGTEPPVDEKFLTGFKNAEWKFVRGFVRDIAAGTGTMPYAQRLGLYIKTIRSMYEAGRVAAHPDYIRIYWRMNAAVEHCPECSAWTLASPFTKNNLPAIPGDGTSSCKANCGCELAFEIPSLTEPTEPLLPPPQVAIPMPEEGQRMMRRFFVRSQDIYRGGLMKALVSVRPHTRTGPQGQTEQVSGYSEARKPGQLRPGDPHPFLSHPPSTPEHRGQAAERGIKVPPVSWGLYLAKDPQAKVQATWYDKTGKKQAAYHPEFVAGQAEKKFSSLQRMHEILPKVEAQLHEDLQRGDADPRRVAAAIVSLIHKAYIRIGSEKYAQEHETFGASSLRKEHVEVGDKGLALRFTGKHNKEQSKTVDAPELHSVLQHMQSLPGERLFQMRTKDGGLKPMTEEHVREYLAPFDLTPKSFRTYHASRLTAERLAKLGAPASEKEAKTNIAQVVQSVSHDLGNTPAVCRSSYINPAILDAYAKGVLNA